MTDIVERLRENARLKSGEAWRRQDGGQDLCIGAMLADEAANKIEQLSEALTEANDMLRSAYQVAKRDGAETGWEAFRTRLMAVLEKQHAIMYPKQEAAPRAE